MWEEAVLTLGTMAPIQPFLKTLFVLHSYSILKGLGIVEVLKLIFLSSAVEWSWPLVNNI